MLCCSYVVRRLLPVGIRVLPLNGQDRLACEDALLPMVQVDLDVCGPEHILAYAVLLIRDMSS